MRIKRTMYFLIATLALLFFTFAAQGEEKPFITKWKGEAGKKLKIPIFGTGYKLVIKKASDNTELKTEASLTITENDNFYTYTPTEDGELLVEAGPEGVEYIRFVYEESKRGSAENLLTVEQFGTVVWKSMYRAFAHCKNMQFAATVGTPDLSNVTNMESMFYGCSSFNQAFSSWNVSNVTDMSSMFSDCSSFNQALSSWNVSNVTDMWNMFSGCSSFNQDLSSWNVSNVTNMGGMFHNCSSFNQDLSSWNVSNVTSMGVMFSGCSTFNQDLSSWNVSNVTYMADMFLSCSSFNQDLSSWNVSNVTNMGGMFYYCSAFNQDLSSWDVSNVTDMGYMFSACSAFNQNMGSWKLKNCQRLGLQNCGMSVENYSKSLDGWAAQADINEKLVLRADGLYFNETAKSARTKLIKGKHWSIIGDVSEGGRVYDLRIGGVQLSTDNINSFQDALTDAGVLKKGRVSATLEGEKPVLLLENAELTAPYDGFPVYMLESRSSEVIIQLQGVCTITQLSSELAIVVRKGTIVGRNTNDKLLVKGDVFFSTAIHNCTVEIEKVLYGYYSGALEIDNAVVKAKYIKNVALTLKNCSILQPEGAHYDAAKREVVDKDGNTAENVVIGSTGGGTTVAVTGVKLSYNNLPLKTGDSFTLLATVEPANATNKAVTWSSDNDAVATVSEAGVVEAKAVGTANIRVTTKDGGYTATCSFTVTAEDVVLTGITISPSEVSVEANKEVTLSVSFEPVSATHKGVKWSSSDPTIATVDEHGKVKGIAAGETTITVVSEKYESVTNTCKVTVIPPTAVEYILFAGISVAPNPFASQLKIKNEEALHARYELVNTNGVVVHTGVLQGVETVLNTEKLTAGVYLLRILAGSEGKTLRVVKE